MIDAQDPELTALDDTTLAKYASDEAFVCDCLPGNYVGTSGHLLKLAKRIVEGLERRLKLRGAFPSVLSREKVEEARQKANQFMSTTGSDDPFDDAWNVCAAFLQEHPDDEFTPITGEWLLRIGCTMKPCHVHETPDCNYKWDNHLAFWQFNGTDEWLTEEPEVSLRTRGDVRAAIYLLTKRP